MNRDWPAHNVASAVVESMRRHKRKPSDFYPTPPAATVALLRRLGLPLGALIGEPACGRGDIAMAAKAEGYEVVASDLRHTGYGMGGYDYLNGEDRLDGSMGWLVEWGLLDAIITNPPFALAEAFIRKATQQAPLVAMLLKSNYWHAASRAKLKRECPPTAQYEVTWRLAFLEAERGKSPLMDCTWWVWKAGDPPLPDHLLMRPHASEVPVLRYPLAVHVADNRFARERLNGLLADG